MMDDAYEIVTLYTFRIGKWQWEAWRSHPDSLSIMCPLYGRLMLSRIDGQWRPSSVHTTGKVLAAVEYLNKHPLPEEP